jgi:hypothetical protein
MVISSEVEKYRDQTPSHAETASLLKLAVELHNPPLDLHLRQTPPLQPYAPSAADELF